IRVAQGPVDRVMNVASITGHTVLGTVSGTLGLLDREPAVALWQDGAAAVVAAAGRDRSHRWSAEEASSAPVGGANAEVDQSAEVRPGAEAGPSAEASTNPEAAPSAEVGPGVEGGPSTPVDQIMEVGERAGAGDSA